MPRSTGLLARYTSFSYLHIWYLGVASLSFCVFCVNRHFLPSHHTVSQKVKLPAFLYINLVFLCWSKKTSGLFSSFAKRFPRRHRSITRPGGAGSQCPRSFIFRPKSASLWGRVPTAHQPAQAHILPTPPLAATINRISASLAAAGIFNFLACLPS